MDEENTKVRIYVVGTLLGALTGLGIALVMVKRAEETGEALQFGTREGLRLGVGILGLLSQVGKLSANVEQ
jgi:hypothetical protein